MLYLAPPTSDAKEMTYGPIDLSKVTIGRQP